MCTETGVEGLEEAFLWAHVLGWCPHFVFVAVIKSQDKNQFKGERRCLLIVLSQVAAFEAGCHMVHVPIVKGTSTGEAESVR